MSKQLLFKDPSDFLKNLKKPSRLSQKPTEGLTTSSESKPNKSVEGSYSTKRSTNQRQSNTFYFSSNSQTPLVSAQTSNQLPSKSQFKDKVVQTQNAITPSSTLNVVDISKKISTSTSIIDLDTLDEKNSHIISQLVTNMNMNLSNMNKVDIIEHSKLKQHPRLQLTHTLDNLSARNGSHMGNMSAQLPSTKAAPMKTRKSVASDMRERTNNDSGHVSGQRSLSKAPVNSQKRMVSPSSFDGKLQKPVNRSPIKIDDADVIPEYITKERKATLTTKVMKPSHPLKEIKIDIGNFADEPIENNNTASTSRNRSKNLLMNPRGELARNEKVGRSRVGSAQTPQSATFTGLSKTRFPAGTPKRDPDAKDPSRSQSLKSQLTEDEIKQYGDRFPDDYEKVDFLGRGGFALVWLGVEKATGKKVAIKQMLKSSSSEAQKKELYFGQVLFLKGGEPRDTFRRYPGITNIASFIERRTTKQDDWMLSELGGDTLSKLLFEIRGEFFKGERIYRVKNANLGQAFKTDKSALPTFIKQIAQVLLLLSDYKIVHSDLKPDNILIKMKDYNPGKLLDLKVIDFGSAYSWSDAGGIGMATPEYMPPESLNILYTNKGTKTPLEQLMETTKPWSVDVWGLGAIILEILTGIPLWMSLKCRIDIGTKSVVRMGIFSAKGRAYDKIYQKQVSVVERLDETLDEHLKYWDNSQNLFDLISRMMALDPMKRISPTDILRHPYLQEAA